MNVSAFKFTTITLLILLMPVYGNWKLLTKGKKTEGFVTEIKKDNAGILLSSYPVIEFQAADRSYRLYGPENTEYPIGKQFPVLYMPDSPKNAIIFTIRGIYFNRLTPFSFALFILWIAFYLSFSPKNKNRKSATNAANTNKVSRRKKLN